VSTLKSLLVCQYNPPLCIINLRSIWSFFGHHIAMYYTSASTFSRFRIVPTPPMVLSHYLHVHPLVGHILVKKWSAAWLCSWSAARWVLFGFREFNLAVAWQGFR
jgi:hypothetical protein